MSAFITLFPVNTRRVSAVAHFVSGIWQIDSIGCASKWESDTILVPKEITMLIWYKNRINLYNNHSHSFHIIHLPCMLWDHQWLWRNLRIYAMKRVAAECSSPTSLVLEPAKCPDDRTYYCPDCKFPSIVWTLGTRFTVEWIVRALQPRPQSTSGEVSSHLALPANGIK